MKLFHTSPAEITEIHSDGSFGEFLFFSADEYVMTTGDYVTYAIDIDEGDLIDAEQLFYHEGAEKLAPLVEQVVSMVGCDEDTAEELIAQTADVHGIDCDIDPEDLAEVSWEIQRITGEAAVMLGFRGVAMNDEQGRAYLIHMAGRADELEAV